MSRGKYIVIEGNDGTGKSTQVELLSKYLKKQNISTFTPHEPGGTPIADAIRLTIKDGTMHREPMTNLLLFTAARYEIWRHAEQKLEEGTWVISSRNYLSTLAYQGGGEGLDQAIIVDTTRQFIGESYLHPDYTIILSLPDDERYARIASAERNTSTVDTFEMRHSDFQERINATYIALAETHGFNVLDASQSVDDVQRAIRTSLQLS